MAQVIVVGGGLSGLSAAHTVLERGGSVVVLDKNSFLGGNSTKATSGINGALTKTQIRLGIQDSVDKFYEDTALSARNLIRPDLVKVLTGNSASAVEWLQEKFALDLSLVSRLGGHSFPRTHRGKERFPGMTITYALMEKMEEIAKAEPSRARIVTKARVTRLLQDEKGNVTGVEVDHAGKVEQMYGIVVLATGGYAADFTEGGLIKQYRPDVFHLPTTNGDYSTGDGHKMVRAISGNLIDLEKVQVHPTGLVDPKEPDAKVKFLAAEALRGVGGILLDANGKRFCDELGHRDYVTGKMNENKGPFRLILNGAASKEIEWHCKHYQGRGLMKHFATGEALAKEMGISTQTLKETFDTYSEIARTKKDPFGKKFFHNVPIDIKDQFFVAFVTPVVHYCMGGLEITPESHVKGPQGIIQGLFACGELAGGVHGANRLGGSSLLGCVVYGRVAGDSASRALFQSTLSGGAAPRRGSLSGQVGGQIRIGVTPAGDRRIQLDIAWDESSASSSSAASSSSSSTPSSASAPAAAASPAAPKADRNREISREEVAKHSTDKDCWVIVNGQVLDVTAFLPEHPGGAKAIMLYAGKDATEEFNMLHKPDVVEKYAPDSIIGKVAGGAPTPAHTSAVRSRL